MYFFVRAYVTAGRIKFGFLLQLFPIRFLKISFNGFIETAAIYFRQVHLSFKSFSTKFLIPVRQVSLFYMMHVSPEVSPEVSTKKRPAKELHLKSRNILLSSSCKGVV